jgi:hypothetical protein
MFDEKALVDSWWRAGAGMRTCPAATFGIAVGSLWGGVIAMEGSEEVPRPAHTSLWDGLGPAAQRAGFAPSFGEFFGMGAPLLSNFKNGFIIKYID